MGSYARKLERNQLRKEIGNKELKDVYHERHDPLWKRLQDGMERAREDKR